MVANTISIFYTHNMGIKYLLNNVKYQSTLSGNLVDVKDVTHKLNNRWMDRYQS
jgi:hypothetical protein